MKFKDYFSNFYMGRSSGGILGHKSKEKIPEYFFKAALLEEYYDLLPTSTAHMENGLMGHENQKALFGALLFRILTKMVLLITLRRT
jgi:hypothetical protein